MKTFAFIRKIEHKSDNDFHYCGYVGINNNIQLPNS